MNYLKLLSIIALILAGSYSLFVSNKEARFWYENSSEWAQSYNELQEKRVEEVEIYSALVCHYSKGRRVSVTKNYDNSFSSLMVGCSDSPWKEKGYDSIEASKIPKIEKYFDENQVKYAHN